MTQTGDALTDRAYALAMRYGGSKIYEGFRTLDAEWDFIYAALPRLLAGDNNRIQTVCSQLEFFLNFTSRLDEAIWLYEQSEICALTANDKDSAGERAYQAGWLYYLHNQPTQVLACATRASNYWENSIPSDKAIAIQLRGHGYRLQGNYPASIAAYQEALEIDRSISHQSDDVASDLNFLAKAEHANKDYDSAERDYREALHIAKLIENDEGIANYTGNLAALALDREHWAEAESLAREALALAEKVGRQELIAGDCQRLAIALLEQNKNLQEALSLSRRAVEIFTRLRHPDLQSAQETLAETEERMKDK